MASAHCATFSVVAPLNTTTRTKPLLLASFSTLFPSKLTKRKNHLRQKILKTLNPKLYPITPLLPQQPPPIPLIPTISPETPLQNDVVVETPSTDASPTTTEEDYKFEEFRTTESVGAVGEYNGIVGKFSVSSVIKFGGYFVGIFVVQTVCAILILGNADSNQKDGNLRISDTGIDEKLFRGKFVNKGGDVVYLDESELEKKIEEIRAMAREARRSEEKESKDNIEDDDIVNESAISKNKTGIEKEIGARLVKLQKRLNSARKKLPASYVNYLGKSETNENGNEVNGTLMFKKKFKFKSPLTNLRSNPKGFQGSKDHSLSKKKEIVLATIDAIGRNGSIGDDGLGLLDREKQVALPDGDRREGVSGTLEEDDGSKTVSHDPKSSPNDGKELENGGVRPDSGEEVGMGNTEARIGVVQKASHARSSVQVVKRRNSLGTQDSQSFRKENQGTATKPDKSDVLSRGGSPEKGEGGNKAVANKVKDKQSDIKTDMWWLSLPYVLAILMRRRSDCEGPGGLFTLKIPSQAQYQSDSSCTVAFEDRDDANNFCYLLESFFEDLGDFSADIVPLSIKELREAVKSRTMKVIVVKKGQLHLYAGQPLADVEMALHSLFEQNKSDYTENSK